MDLAQQTESGVLLRLSVQPRARRDEVLGVHGDRIRVRLTSPPVDNAANKSLTQFIAARLGVRRAQVSVVSVLCNRRKSVLVEGVELDAVKREFQLPG